MSYLQLYKRHLTISSLCYNLCTPISSSLSINAIDSVLMQQQPLDHSAERRQIVRQLGEQTRVVSGVCHEAGLGVEVQGVIICYRHSASYFLGYS